MYMARKVDGVMNKYSAGPSASQKTMTDALVERKAQQNKAAPKLVINLNRAGREHFIAGAVGKSFAPAAFTKNMDAISDAINKGEDKYINHKGEEVHLGKATTNQRLMARKWANRGKIESREGVKKFGQGFLQTARETDTKLREGLNTGSVSGTETRMEDLMTRKEPNALQKRQARLEVVAGMFPQKPPPTENTGAPAPGIKSSTPPPPMAFGAITPTSSAGGPHKPAISRYLNTQAQTTPGGSIRSSPGAVEPTPIVPPIGTSTEDGSAPPAPAPEPTAPTEVVLQDPEPLDDPVPAQPRVPTEPASIGDALGGSGDEG